MAIANYIMSQRPIVPSIDLNVAQNAINKIQEGSEKALELESELKTAVASLDLHASEDGFKQQLVNDIEVASENSADVPYYSLPQLIKAKGNIFSNPGLTGRLRANQAYKEFQAQVDANPNINDNVKRYTKAMNPYHYEDKIENGVVVGGSEWKPIFTPVKSTDFNDVLKIAAQYASPEKVEVNRLHILMKMVDLLLILQIIMEFIVLLLKVGKD